MVKNIVVIGAGGHARSVVNLLELNGYAVKAIVDKKAGNGEKIYNGGAGRR